LKSVDKSLGAKFMIKMRKSSINGMALLLLFFCTQCFCEAKANIINIEKTLNVSKTIPEYAETTNSPDQVPPYYQTLNSTHFSYRCYVPYTLKSKLVAIEVCEINPVKLQIFNWPETEIISLVEGEVNIIEEDGSVANYSAGDVFVLPEGFKGIWNQKVKIKKITVRHPLVWQD
jgi:hypothetical protein